MNTFGRSRLRALAAASVLALGLAGCGTDSAGPDPIKIGASLPLTGEFSQPGQAAQQGYQVWEAMINESGGLLGRARQADHQGRRVATRTPSSPTTTR